MKWAKICNNHIYIENINCYDTEGEEIFHRAFVQMFAVSGSSSVHN